MYQPFHLFAARNKPVQKLTLRQIQERG